MKQLLRQLNKEISATPVGKCISIAGLPNKKELYLSITAKVSDLMKIIR